MGQAAKSVLEAARRAGILVAHVVIDYQPAFFLQGTDFCRRLEFPPCPLSGECRQMVHDVERDSVGFVRKSGATILQNDDSKVGVSGMSGCRLDHEFSGHAH